MNRKAKAKAKVGGKRTRTKDLGAKRAGAVKGGIAWGGPTKAVKVDFLTNPANLRFDKSL
jgi:hypothetical protein